MAMRPASCASALVSSVSSVLQAVLANPPLHNAVQRSVMHAMAGNTGHWYEIACSEGICVGPDTNGPNSAKPIHIQGAVAAGVPSFPFSSPVVPAQPSLNMSVPLATHRPPVNLR